MRDHSILPPDWRNPNPASVSLHLGGRQNRAWGLTVMSGRWRPGSGKDPRPGCELGGRRTGLPAVRQPSRRHRVPALPGAYGHGWLPSVEEGDDGEDALVGVQGGGDSELAEDTVDVLFYRTLSYPKGLSDPGVGLTRGH
jgi:hypothetical protein